MSLGMKKSHSYMERFVCFFMVLCLPMTMLAQQKETNADVKPKNQQIHNKDKVVVTQNSKPSAEKQTKKEQPIQTNKAPKQANDNFVPSEEISEDLAVSFPVDI